MAEYSLVHKVKNRLTAADIGAVTVKAKDNGGLDVFINDGNGSFTRHFLSGIINQEKLNEIINFHKDNAPQT